MNNKPFIQLNNPMPGIVGLLWDKTNSGKALSNLAQVLLQGPSPLTIGERELIGTYVSHLNGCKFCCNSHTAVTECFISPDTIEKVKKDPETSPISPKMKKLLLIAGKVQQSGKAVLLSHIEDAKAVGATDQEIHDTVLIAASFCMYNRYVDGLNTQEPEDKNMYRESGQRLAKHGYRLPNFLIRNMVIYLTKKKVGK